jgi:hypothetical protein
MQVEVEGGVLPSKSYSTGGKPWKVCVTEHSANVAGNEHEQFRSNPLSSPIVHFEFCGPQPPASP